MTEARFQTRGKFLFQGDEKLFMKVLRVRTLPTRDLRETSLNTVWIASPTHEDVSRATGEGLLVVVDLGFEAVMRASRQEQREWWRRTVDFLDTIEHEDRVVAVDLGAGHSTATLNALGERRWLGRIRSALHRLRRLAGTKLITNTLSVRREGRQFRFGHSIEPVDPARTFHQMVRLPVDFVSFEIRDQDPSDLRASLAILQIVCYDLALVAHLPALDSKSMGSVLHAEKVETQIRLGFNAACAGIVLPMWQDDETLAGGLIDPRGAVKPALAAASRAFRDTPFGALQLWPSVSVVICGFNSADTLNECLAHCATLNYPNYEVVVVIDRSSDGSEAIAQRWSNSHGFKTLVPVENRGLSAARNVGASHATGEILAYLDADAYPDSDWLKFLAMAFMQTKHAIIGGPNLNPLNATAISDCIDKSPGNPGVVMLDSEACDHVAGCNLAIRRPFFEAIGGFSEKYVAGGDDGTLCWRTIRYGGALGFAPGAQVWHYRRWTVDKFLRQQRTYGRGEHALEKDWPERFNSLGHAVAPDFLPGWKRTQPLAIAGMYQPFSSTSGFLMTLGRLPEFLLLLCAFVCLSLFGVIWPAFAIFLLPTMMGFVIWIAPALLEAARAPLREPKLKYRAVVAFLFLAQPIARARGRWGEGMTPWRNRLETRTPFLVGLIKLIRGMKTTRASEMGAAQDAAHAEMQTSERLAFLASTLRERLIPFALGSKSDNWNLQVEGGLFGGARVQLDHGRSSVWHRRLWLSRVTKSFIASLAALFIFSISVGAWPVAALSTVLVGVLFKKVVDQAFAALEVLESAMSVEAIPGSDLRKALLPPRHFMVDLAPPIDSAGARQPVLRENKPSLDGRNLHENRGVATHKFVISHS